MKQELNVKTGGVLCGFRLEEIREIPELRSVACRFTHVKTGARLIHLYNDDPNNLFSIAFRTPVSDSTGVPHILEHSVLCGSKKFPIKDPFQEMLKGSLQTFLNAMTYPDKTVYPVSSQVEKDFYNLVDVYCDAVLNPILAESTFQQEGWHFDLENPTDEVGIKGIVYNEMKGVFSDFSSHVGRGTIAKLFPDTTYANESGGEPEHITDLTYEQFKDFHRKFYHPSNSYIFLYGNLPSEKTLRFLDEKYLSAFDALPVDSSVKPQALWDAPREAIIEAPAPEGEEGSATVVCAWIFGDSADPVSALSGSILSHYLLSTESSPLKRALIDSGLGEDLDDMTGFDSDLTQSLFTVGLRKTKPENARAVLDVIMNTLKREVERGLDGELVEGAVRQAEFHLREITSGHFPYNIRLADRCYRSWINGGDPFALLAFEGPLGKINAELASCRGGRPRPPADNDGDGATDCPANNCKYFENLIREKLIDNNHRLLFTIAASPKMGKDLEEQSAKQAKRLTAGFTDEDRRKCFETTKSLRELQNAPPSPEAVASLPKITKGDLPREGRKVPSERGAAGEVPVIMHPIFTSGIAYLDVGFDFSGIPADLVMYIPLYMELLTRCGAAGNSYERMAKRISLSTGGIDASTTCRTKIGTDDELFFMGFLHGKTLEPRFGEMLGIMEDLLTAPDLSNKKQIKDLLLEERNALNASVIHSGHSLAMTSASARLSKSRAVDEMVGGITQLRFLDAAVKRGDYDLAAESCAKLHDFLIDRQSCVISLTSNDPLKFAGALDGFARKLPAKANVKKDVVSVKSMGYGDNNPAKKAKNLAIEISSAVNFAARAWKIKGLSAAENGRMFLLSRNLSTGYLWDKIRVLGGAYGGSAGMSISHPVFTCASYRDPNLEETLKHFEKGLQEVAALIDTKKVDQSVVGAIGRIDHPKNPHGLGLGETMDILTGCTPEFRREFRDAVLGATPESLKQAAERVLAAEESAVTVLGSSAAFDKAEAEGVAFDRREKLVP